MKAVARENGKIFVIFREAVKISRLYCKENKGSVFVYFSFSPFSFESLCVRETAARHCNAL